METESEKARTKVPRALWSDQNIADLKKINIIVSVIIFRHLIGPHDTATYIIMSCQGQLSSGMQHKETAVIPCDCLWQIVTCQG